MGGRRTPLGVFKCTGIRTFPPKLFAKVVLGICRRARGVRKLPTMTFGRFVGTFGRPSGVGRGINAGFTRATGVARRACGTFPPADTGGAKYCPVRRLLKHRSRPRELEEEEEEDDDGDDPEGASDEDEDLELARGLFVALLAACCAVAASVLLVSMCSSDFSSKTSALPLKSLRCSPVLVVVVAPCTLAWTRILLKEEDELEEELLDEDEDRKSVEAADQGAFAGEVDEDLADDDELLDESCEVTVGATTEDEFELPLDEG